MTTACSSPAVVTHNNRWLVVAGGELGDKYVVARVEALDTSTYRTVVPMCTATTTALFNKVDYTSNLQIIHDIHSMV